VLSAAFGQDREFLGRTTAQWNQELSSATGQERVLAAWAIAQVGGRAEGTSALADLAQLVRDSDPTVRYWGALGLKAHGQKLAESDRSPAAAVIETLQPLLAVQSAAARIAAAEALGTLGQAERALSVLVASMDDPQESVRIQAVAALEKLGPAARPAQATLEKATSDPSEYVKRISERALAALDPGRKPGPACRVGPAGNAHR
jgi:hypothetical protein